jgi:hypothetical protein
VFIDHLWKATQLYSSFCDVRHRSVIDGWLTRIAQERPRGKRPSQTKRFMLEFWHVTEVKVLPAAQYTAGFFFDPSHFTAEMIAQMNIPWQYRNNDGVWRYYSDPTGRYWTRVNIQGVYEYCENPQFLRMASNGSVVR